MFIVISGPSAVGKTTIIQMLKEVLPVRLPVSVTDRPPRPGEIEGVSYHFVTSEEFQRLIESEAFIEHVQLEHRYGTPKSEIENASDDLVLDLDVNGAMKIQTYYPNAVLIFIAPPSLDELAKRLLARNDGMDELELHRRLIRAAHELAYTDIYDYVITNYELQQTFEEVLSVIQKVLKNE